MPTNPGQEIDQSYTVSIRASHPTIAAEAIASAMGLDAVIAQTGGGPRMSRKGPVPGRKARETFMLFELERTAEALPQFLKRWTAHVRSRKAADEWRDLGAVNLEFFVGLFLKGANELVLLEAGLLNEMGEAGIDLLFDIYGAD